MKYFYMKIVYSEYLKDYSSYTFSYAPYCMYEKGDKLEDIYHLGFLPYTGNVHLDSYMCYMARSLRVDLEGFKRSSENRRVDRKFEGISFDREIIPIEEFDILDPHFTKFCTDYSKERFKGGEMSADRLQYVLNSPFATHIIKYSEGDNHIAFILACMNDSMLHYWYSFFSLDRYIELPLGKWLMLDSIEMAKETGRNYCYLGTCYGAHSLYKVRDFKSLEFFDGMGWKSDVKCLKAWCKSDDEPLSEDRFKSLDDGSANKILNELKS